MKYIVRLIVAVALTLGIGWFTVPAQAEGAHFMPRPLRAENPVPCCRRPLRAEPAAYATVADAQVEAPVELLRVYLVAVAYNTTTGEILGGMTAKFPTMEACKAIASAPLGQYLPVPPPGHRVYVECKNPSDVSA